MTTLEGRQVTASGSLDVHRLRAWAPTLSEAELSSALAGLGALAAASEATNGRELKAWLRTHESARTLTALVQAPPQESARVKWSMGPLIRHGAFVPPEAPELQPSRLSVAWQQALSQAHTWERKAIATLEIQPASLELSALDELSRLLAPVGGSVGAVVSEPGLGTGAEFRWPMRIAVPPGARGTDLRDQVEDDININHPSFAELVEFLDPAGPHERCEILLAPGTLDDAIRELDQVRHGIDASCLIALGGLGGTGLLTAGQLRAGLEAAVDPWAIAVVEVAEPSRGGWFSELVRQLSHDLTLEHALRLTAEQIGTTVPFVVSDPRALATMGVRAALIRALEALPTADGDLVDLPPTPQNSFAYPSGRYERRRLIEAVADQGAFGLERMGATATSALNREAEREEIRAAAQPAMAEPPEPQPTMTEPPERHTTRAKPPGPPNGGREAAPRARNRGRHAAAPRARNGGGGERRAANGGGGHAPVAGNGGAVPAPEQPKPPGPRAVPARYLRGEVLRRRGRADERVPSRLEPRTGYILEVSIGEPAAGFAHANEPVPDEVIPREGERHRLRIVLDAGGRAKSQTAMIELPATGDSTTCRFRFRSSAEGRLDGRLIVVFRNRVLQTALVTVADKGLQIEVESVVRPGLVALSPRRAFDLAFVSNHNGDGRSRVAALADGWTGVLPQKIDPEVNAIRTFLTDAATNARAHTGLKSAATVELMFKLARRGRRLRGLVVPEGDPKGLGDPDRTRYVQVVSANASAIFPVELFYDFPAPNAKALCPNAQAALDDGRCDPARFHGPAAPDGTIPVVCPAGFWAMNRVIERYASPREVIPALAGYDFGVRSEPVGKRDKLGNLMDALFAWSNLVPDAEAKKVSDALKAATNGKSRDVDTWTAWVKAIQADGPGLLVLLSHTDQDRDLLETALYIAQKEACLVGSFGRPYVRGEKLAGGAIDTRPGPLVFLLGCDTARAWTEYQSFVVLFRENHAALVVGTVGSVAARRAPNVAAKLVEALAARTAAGGAGQAEAFGDVLLAARRKLLKDGEVMALALTSYGDADWKFG
jgi:hypothetical protein